MFFLGKKNKFSFSYSQCVSGSPLLVPTLTIGRVPTERRKWWRTMFKVTGCTETVCYSPDSLSQYSFFSLVCLLSYEWWWVKWSTSHFVQKMKHSFRYRNLFKVKYSLTLHYQTLKKTRMVHLLFSQFLFSCFLNIHFFFFSLVVIAVQLPSHVQLFEIAMECITPGFPVLHFFPEFAQTHV